jgi:hypothetical protein
MYSKKKIESFEREARLGFPSLCNRVVEDLRVWQKGIQLVKQVYIITNEGKLSKDFGLKDQLRRASVSIPTNVAEGFERRSRKEYVNFLSLGARSRLNRTEALASYADAGSHRNIAKGSAGELRSLLRVALEVDYIEQSTYSQLNDRAIELFRMLFNQIQSINRASSA